MTGRLERDITRNWKTKKTLVSVCCIVYNHEAYIKDAIEGFLMQKTTFPFEIIIHDDASTDRTANIVREYEKKYPSIISPIYQKENQYSQGVKCSSIAWSRAKGEYVAFCEGDDYWTDPLKLQIQMEELYKHQKCDMSFHPAFVKINCKTVGVMSKHCNQSRIFDLNFIISSDGGVCPTNSLLIKKNALKEIPEWFYKDAPVGDYFIQAFGAKRGGALYINRVMSTYRSQVPGSWSERSGNAHIDDSKKTIHRYVSCIEKMAKDFPRESRPYLKRACSVSLLSLAIHSIKKNEKKTFAAAIRKSYNLFPGLNLIQIMLYRLRWSGAVLFKVCQLAAYLRKMFRDNIMHNILDYSVGSGGACQARSRKKIELE